MIIIEYHVPDRWLPLSHVQIVDNNNARKSGTRMV